MKNLSIVILFLGSIAANAGTMELEVDPSPTEPIKGTITAEQIAFLDVTRQFVISKPHVRLSPPLIVGGLKTDSLIFEADDDTANRVCSELVNGTLVKGSVLRAENRSRVIGKLEVVRGILSFSPGPYGTEILSMTCAMP